MKHSEYVQRIVKAADNGKQEVTYIYPLPKGRTEASSFSKGFITDEGFTTFEFHFDFNISVPEQILITGTQSTEPWKAVEYLAKLHKSHYEKIFQSL